MKRNNCNNCNFGYEGGCGMYEFLRDKGRLDDSYFGCKRFISKKRAEELRKYSRPSKGGTTESDLD